MHESDDPRGKVADDKRLLVSDSLSETDPIPPNRAHDQEVTVDALYWGLLIPPRGWAGIELQVIAAVGHGDCPLRVNDF